MGWGVGVCGCGHGCQCPSPHPMPGCARLCYVNPLPVPRYPAPLTLSWEVAIVASARTRVHDCDAR